MDAAQNGVPIVHIAPPSAAGVSRNQYDQFNVNPNGLILNNSAAPVQTQQGGWITGNLQLGATPARIIVNEVVTNQSSQLRGTIEVAGRRADIVIANPNGISCDGCGFLNTGRATLTTGQTRFGIDGAIDGFDVRQGQLTVGGKGLNAGNLEQLDLIARGVVIEGEVWASNLNLIAGANTVLYGTLQAAAQSGSGVAPRFAIDIKDLGGMVANQVYLLATEQGLGVNSTGRLAALQGNLVLSAGGDLTLKDSYASKDMRITSAGNVSLAGQTLGDGSISVTAAGALANTGALDAGARLDLHAFALANAGSIAQRNADGASLSATGRFSNSGSIYGAGALDIAGATIVDTGGSLQASGPLRLLGGSIALDGTHIATDASAVIAASAGPLAARNTQLRAGGDLDASASGAFDASGSDWQVQRNASLRGAALTNVRGALLANGQLTVNAGGAIDNTDGTMSARQVELHGAAFNNGRGVVAANADLAITSGALSNQQGLLQAGAGLRIDTQGQALINTGSGNSGGNSGGIVAGAALDIAAGSLDNQGGLIASSGNQTLAIAGNLDNSASGGQAGQLFSRGDSRITAVNVSNRGSRIDALGSLAISGAALDNRGGSIAADGAAVLTLSSLDNRAQGQAPGNAGGTIDASSIRLDAGTIDNTGGALRAGTDATLNTAALDNTGGTLSAGSKLAVAAAALRNDGGRLIGDQAVLLGSGSVALGGTVASANDVTLNIAGDYTNTGLVSSHNSVNIHAANIVNNGVLTAGHTLSAETGNLVNAGEMSGRTVLLNALGTLTNAGSGLIDGVDTRLHGADIANAGRIYGDWLRLSGGTLGNSAGGTIAARDTLLIGVQTLNNTGDGLLYSLGDIGIGGTIDAGGQLQGSALALLNASSKIEARRHLAMAAASIVNRNDRLLTQTVTAAPVAENQVRPDGSASAYALDQCSGIGGGQDKNTCIGHPGQFEDYTLYRVNATSSYTELVSSAPGQILAGANMTLAGSVVNLDSHIVAGGDLAIAGPAVDNRATKGETRTDYSGTTEHTQVEACGTFGGSHCREWHGKTPYNPAPVLAASDLPTLVYQKFAGDQTAGRDLTASVTGPGAGGHSAAPTPALVVSVTGSHDVIVSAPSALTMPKNGLFTIHAEPGARYIVETDPRFTDLGNFIGSDYLLQALNGNPERQLKRYGDAFTEQQLVNDQILALTGRRYLSGYSSTEDEYKGLMDAGVAYARQYQLTPGVALSAQQMALLSTDIVWLIERTVALPDGSNQAVLVPQVYLRRPQGQDLQPNGALITASTVLVRTAGDLVNSGTISGNAVSVLAGRDLVNLSGRIQGQSMLLRANNDLRNLSGVIAGEGSDSSVTLLAGRDIVLRTSLLDTASGDGTSTRSNVQRVATVQGGNVRLDAARDITASGASASATGDLVATAGRDLSVGTVAGEYRLAVADRSGRTTQGRSAYITEATTGNQVATLAAGRDMALVAQGDVALKGADVAAGAGAASASGNLLIQGQNVSIAAATDRSAFDIQTIGAKSYNRVARDDEKLVGGAVAAGNDVTLNAGGGNLALSGASVAALSGQVTFAAGNDIALQNAITRHQAIDDSYSKSGNLLTTVATTTASSQLLLLAEGSSVSGNTILAQAGRDLTVRGSSVAGDGDVTLAAGNNVAISAATSTRTDQRHSSIQESGFLSGGSFGISYGQRTTTTDQQQDGTTQSGQSRSLVGSNNGSLNIGVGNALKVGGSDLAAGQDITLAGKSVTIDPGRDDSQGRFATRMTQDALTLAVGGSVVNTIQTVQSMSDAAGQTSNTRVKALAAASAAMAAASAAMAAANAAKDVAANGVSINISLTAGHAESEQMHTNASSNAIGSTVAAGNNLGISATGGKGGNIAVVGSDLNAKNDINLRADNRIDLLAAQDLEARHSQSSNSSAAAGIAAGYSIQGGAAIGYTASVAAGQGNEDGSGITQRNTQVIAGNKLTLASGGDSNLVGAVASGRQVSADVSGNLNIESLQDTAKFDSKSQSANLGVIVGYGASVSGGVNQSKIKNDYASVQQQSGILAGDDGYNIKVQGNTDLKGAVIASSQAAIDGNKNSLSSASLTHSDIKNHAIMEADSLGLSGSALMGGGDGQHPQENGQGQGPGGANLINAGATGSAASLPGIMALGSNDASTTGSGISGGAIVITDAAQQQAKTGKTGDQTIASLNRNVATGSDSSGKLANDFDQNDVQARMTISTAFVQQAAPLAANLIGNVGKAKQDAAARDASMNQALADQARSDADSWGDDGINRAALHAATQALIGGLAGGNAGALSSASGVAAGSLGQQMGKTLGEAQADKQRLSGSARDRFVNTYQQTLATLGGALGGLAAGGATGQGGMAVVAAATQGGNAAAAVDV
jgi:filamentous hemagglutinin